MTGNYTKTIRLLNIIQLLGWLGLVASLYAGWKVYAVGTFVEALALVGPSALISLVVMAACQIGGVLIDIARSTANQSA